MKHVKMTRDDRGPHPGQTLGAGSVVTLGDREAAALVATGSAHYCGPDGKPAAPAAPPPAPTTETTADEPGPRKPAATDRRPEDRAG